MTTRGLELHTCCDSNFNDAPSLSNKRGRNQKPPPCRQKTPLKLEVGALRVASRPRKYGWPGACVHAYVVSLQGAKALTLANTPVKARSNRPRDFAGGFIGFTWFIFVQGREIWHTLFWLVLLVLSLVRFFQAHFTSNTQTLTLKEPSQAIRCPQTVPWTGCTTGGIGSASTSTESLGS